MAGLERTFTRAEASKEMLLVVAGLLVGGLAWPDQALAGSTGRAIRHEGRRWIGTPYVPGGTNLHKGVDCDAYTKKVAARCGIYLPWGPTAQAYGGFARGGRPRCGDLVSFKERGPGGPITHVALYSGNGNILHASSYWNQVVEKPMRYVKGYTGNPRVYR